MQETPCVISSARKTASRFGFGLCCILLVATVLQTLWFTVLPRVFGEDCWLVSSSWGMWLGSFAPLYAIAMPLAFLIIRPMDAHPPQENKLSAGKFLVLIPICFCMMYGGNIIGTVLSMVLSGGTAENAIMNLALDNNPLKILVMVILAPALEELIFRKLLIDRTRIYGEKLAVFLSGITFGLMHQNLFQFFYAFGLGLIFAYIYTRTGRLRYSIIFHSIINFMGSVLAPWIISLLDMELLASMDSVSPEQLLSEFGAMLPGLIIYFAYAMFLVGLAFVGLILLIVKRKDITWEETEQPLPKGSAIKALYCNPGMLLFILLCLIAIVMALI